MFEHDSLDGSSFETDRESEREKYPAHVLSFYDAGLVRGVEFSLTVSTRRSA
jgi:hypothetical protein